MSLQTHVSGSPAEFVDAARRLRALAAALHDGSQTLTAATRVSSAEFDGVTARAFTTTTAALAPGVRGLADDSRGFAAATLTYADQLEEVQQVMRRARRIARGRGLRVRAGAIDRPDDATPEQQGVYDRLRPIVASAWAVLARAEEDLQHAAQLADPMDPVVRARTRGTLSGIPPSVDPATDPTVAWPPREADWPAEQPTPEAATDRRDPSTRTADPVPDRPGHGSGGSRVEADAASPALPPLANSQSDPRPGPAYDVTGAVPDGWAVQSHPDPGVILSAQAPVTDGDGLPARIVVRADPLTGPVAVWQAQQVAALGQELPGFEVEDSAAYELGGRAVSWVQYSHDVATTTGVVEVVEQQWAWHDGGRVVTVTGSAAADDADACAPLFQQVAAVLGNQRGVSGDRPAPGHLAEGRW